MSELAPGRRIDDFEIIEVAGEGGMGVVYRAIQISLGREVALKLIAPVIANEPDFRTRFDHESRLAASIDHPHVVSIYAAGEHEGRPYLAMQWIPGRGLDRSLRQGPLELERTVAVISQIGGALDVAHATGLVHRDVKPGNILLRSFGGRDHAYLVDFGIARNTAVGLAGVTRTGSMVGTLGYMAPEQLRGERGDARSDLYALGCVAFESLTGRRPFERDNEAAVLWAHGHDPRPRPSQVAVLSGSFDELISRALAIDPDERFQSGAELALALEAASEGAPIPPPEPRPAAIAGFGDPDAATASTRSIAAPTDRLEPEAPTAVRPLPTDPRPAGAADARPLRGVLAAILAGLAAAALVVAVGMAVAAASPREGFIDLQGAEQVGALEEGLRQAWSFSQASLELGGDKLTARTVAATLVLFPLLACLLAGLACARLTRGARPLERLAWGAGCGVPYAIVMLLLAASTGDITGEGFTTDLESRPAQVGLLSLLWGALGGAGGAGLALRRDQRSLPAPVGAVATTLWAAWLPLLSALVVATAIGTSALIVQTLRDAGDVRSFTGRSEALAAGETAVYALDHGVRFLALGAGAEFQNPGLYGVLGMPLPVTKFTEVAPGSGLDPRALLDQSAASGYRIFDYEPALPVWAFAGLLGLIAIPVVFALQAGGRVARARGARSAVAGAAWGLLVGPAWAAAVTGVAAVAQKQLYGEVELGSVLVMFLVGAAAPGAVGGALGGWRAGRREGVSEPGHPRGRGVATPRPVR